MVYSALDNLSLQTVDNSTVAKKQTQGMLNRPRVKKPSEFHQESRMNEKDMESLINAFLFALSQGDYNVTVGSIVEEAGLAIPKKYRDQEEDDYSPGDSDSDPDNNDLDDDITPEVDVRSCRTYSDAALLTYNKGVVAYLESGDRLQITIVPA